MADAYDDFFGGGLWDDVPRPSAMLRADLEPEAGSDDHDRRRASGGGGRGDGFDGDLPPPFEEGEEEGEEERVLPGRRPKKAARKKNIKKKKGGPIRRKQPGSRHRATPIPAHRKITGSGGRIRSGDDGYDDDDPEDDELAERAVGSVTRTIAADERVERAEVDDDDDEEEEEEESEIEFATIGQMALETRNRILSDAHQVFNPPPTMGGGGGGGGGLGSSSRCYLCAYGHRGIDGLGSQQGLQLHGELMRIIAEHLYTSGAKETTEMAAEFFNNTMRKFFAEIDTPAPEFDMAQIYIHLSTPLHTKNNRIFYNWALERMATTADALFSEVKESGHGCNVAKAREARQTLITMRDFYKDKIEQVSFGAPTPGDIQPAVIAYMSRTQLLSSQLPTMSPAALSFVQSLGAIRTVVPSRGRGGGARVEEMVQDAYHGDDL